MRKTSVILVSIVASFASALPAFAHTGGAGAALDHGFAHPFTGLDHLLAMTCVGVLAAAMGGRALVTVPLAFLAMTVVGALVGVAAIGLPGVELGIAASVAVLGALLAAGARPHLAPAGLLVGLFAVFHGYAHGSEMPPGASGLAFFAGFVAATALLHIAGIAIGLIALRRGDGLNFALRGAGGVVLAVGIALIVRTI